VRDLTVILAVLVELVRAMGGRIGEPELPEPDDLLGQPLDEVLRRAATPPRFPVSLPAGRGVEELTGRLVELGYQCVDRPEGGPEAVVRWFDPASGEVFELDIHPV
jgi:hypothetical protein